MRALAQGLRYARGLQTASGPVPLWSTQIAADPPTNAHLPPVVMLHGVLASSATYRSILRRPDFAPGRSKIGIDLRNHGQSPHAAGMSYEQMADDVMASLAALDVERAVLVGHSMGGKVAMQVALTAPETVSSLVVVDVAPVRYVPGKSGNDPGNVVRSMREIDPAECKDRREVDGALERAGVSSEAVRQFAITNLAKDADGRLRWRLNLDAIVDALPDIIGFPEHTNSVYSGATCAIRGGKSPYVPFSAMRRFTSLFPQTKLVTLSDAGHWLQAEQPDAFVTSVNAFLEDER